MADRAYIKLYRQVTWHERNNPFANSLNIFVDNKKVDTIQPNEEKLLSVSPGSHNIRVKLLLGAGSETLEINVPTNGEISLECGWSPLYIENSLKLFIAAFVIITVVFLGSLMLGNPTFSSNSRMTNLFFGGMIILFILIWSIAMLSGLIALFKPGWIFYLKELK